MHSKTSTTSQEIANMAGYFGGFLYGETTSSYLLFSMCLKTRFLKKRQFIHSIPALPELYIPEGKYATQMVVSKYLQEFIRDYLLILRCFTKKDPMELLKLIEENIMEASGYWIRKK